MDRTADFKPRSELRAFNHFIRHFGRSPFNSISHHSWLARSAMLLGLSAFPLLS